MVYRDTADRELAEQDYQEYLDEHGPLPTPDDEERLVAEELDRQVMEKARVRLVEVTANDSPPF